MRDEIEFNQFYHPTPLQEHIIHHLHALNADAFIPIFVQGTLTGYILLEKGARDESYLFSIIDRDEITIFATYIGNVINLLEYGNIYTLLREQKKLTEELYSKHQEIKQYKESLRSFLKLKERKIGIIFYKNRRFTFGNQAATELLGINPNNDDGHPLTIALKKAIAQVNLYKTNQTCYSHDSQGNKLVCVAIPGLEENSTIITVYYPELIDTIQAHTSALKDPSDWDYLLYLETTASGQLINNLIPGSSETLLAFKIQYLRAALSRKALLIDVPHEDNRAIVEIIHHISLRSELHILTLTTQEKNQEIALKLFGINPLYNNNKQEPALFEKLSTTGTLVIENVELLSLETQNKLAEYIMYGYYKPLKSEQRMPSSLRLMFTSHKNLRELAHAGVFSAALAQEILATSLHFPSLMTLPQQELSVLLDGYLQQSTHTDDLGQNPQLNEKEKLRILSQKPLSLIEFRDMIQAALTQKSAKKQTHEITFTPSSSLINPELHMASRLGKRALKDPRLMSMLWSTYKNQTKIATLLGVNRSSVNRRCKEYNLL